ncbi:MAG: cobyrinate a,c-diamide synthase [Desulfobacteraceae bacterium]|nr:MAG: cobyrinate a,c-diamide synthase [Desulfobacteraceae bacterium]
MTENRKRIPAFCIAGTHSGCGKTTIALGIMAALGKRGYRVQPYKVGPDFIDPGHHRRITGVHSHNLDSWMLGRSANRELFHRNLHDKDAAVVEGVMGLFDGFSGNSDSGSTALISKWLNLPVVLVIDARSMARSAAAVALGFSRFDPELQVGGVLFNRVGSKTHRGMLREAMEQLPDMAVYGFLPREKSLEIPSRHLGLITDEEYTLDSDRIAALSAWIEENVRLDDLLAATSTQEAASPLLSRSRPAATRIAVAMDEAFCFYYRENLRLLEEAGAELVPFSPIRSKTLPEQIRGIFLGGGYPEMHCRQISENRELLSAVREFGMAGRPIYAECGGFMYLMESITGLDGTKYPMVGLFPMRASMEERLHALGYREVVVRKISPVGSPGTRIRGHEFHYSRIDHVADGVERVYSMQDRLAMVHEEGYLSRNVLGSYVHLHWGSNPDVAQHFVEYCRRYG